MKAWTVEEFMRWVPAQESKYEFDGSQPVAMTGGSANHTAIAFLIQAALRSRLRGKGCSAFGPDLGVATAGNRIRYPDVLVTCTPFSGTDLLAPDPVIVFEVLSGESSRRDRIEKVRDYASVASIRHYVIVESASIGAMALARDRGGAPWITTPLVAGESLALPEIGTDIPIEEFYLDVAF